MLLRVFVSLLMILLFTVHMNMGMVIPDNCMDLVHSIDVSQAPILVQENNTFLVKNKFLTHVEGNAVACATEDGHVILENTTLDLTNDFFFCCGSLEIKGDVCIWGNSKFVYISNHPLIIHKNSRLIFEDGAMFCYVPKNKNQNLIVCEDSTSQLVFNNASLVPCSAGLQLTRGNILFQGHSYVGGHWMAPDSTVIFGDMENVENDHAIYIAAHSKLHIFAVKFFFNNVVQEYTFVTYTISAA